MYCVKCGVRLEDNPEKCPLCATPVWNPDGAANGRPQYSEEMPPAGKSASKIAAAVLTVLSAAAAFTVFIVARRLDESYAWAGYVLLGIALGYIACVLPMWFKKYHPAVFIPVNHAAAAGYLLYICLKTGGSWFLPFALPTAAVSCALFTALGVLFSHIRQKPGYVLGGFILLCGAFSLLIEFLAHITFGLGMFKWSLYSLAACTAVGGFMLLAEMIPPLRSFIRRNFFY